jgi:hypothetical protein
MVTFLGIAFVQGQIGYKSLEPSVLLLLEPTGLISPHPSIFPPSLVISLLLNPELAAHFVPSQNSTHHLFSLLTLQWHRLFLNIVAVSKFI